MLTRSQSSLNVAVLNLNKGIAGASVGSRVDPFSLDSRSFTAFILFRQLLFLFPSEATVAIDDVLGDCIVTCGEDLNCSVEEYIAKGIKYFYFLEVIVFRGRGKLAVISMGILSLRQRLCREP